jgi:hypothetical protein
MREKIVLSLVFVLFAACSSPLLEWIESETGSLYVAAASDKAITAFSFGISGETDTIRTKSSAKSGKVPITVILPAGRATDSLTPAIEYIGKSVSPESGIPQNFNSPVTYRVSAEDGSWLDYEVEVIVKTAHSAEIIWFDLELPGGGSLMAEGDVIEGSSGQPGEIILHVPSEVDPHSLTAKIVQTGTLSGLGVSGDTRTAITLTGNFSADQSEAARTYTVTAEDNITSKKYIITVLVDGSPVKEITEFSFDVFPNKAIISAEPQLDGKYPIIATVPVSANLGDLKPAIKYKGASIAGLGIGNTDSDTNTNPVGEKPTPTASTGKDFKTPVTYRVTAQDGSSIEYEVTVYKSDLNTGKAITGFYFPAVQGILGSAGIINETAKTIAVTVPAGTNLSSLAPAIYHTGASIDPISGKPMDFSNSVAAPVIYTVTARDGGTETYEVSVFVAKRGDKAITAFDFADVSGEAVVIGGTPGLDGKIPIVVTVPYNTDLTTRTPAVTHTGASITGGGIPAGGPGTVTGSPSNFSGPVTYTVTAEDGTIQDYSVTVVKAADPTLQATSNLASIDGFYFNNPVATGVINGQNITVTVPAGTDVTNLIPTIYFTGNTVGLGDTPDTDPGHAPSTSGSSPPVTKPYMSSPASIATNFTNSVKYTVTPLSQNAVNAKTYTVTVNFGPAPPKSDVRAITYFGFDEVDEIKMTAAISPAPDASGKYPVEVIVPVGTNLTSLKPVVVIKGVAISGEGLPATLDEFNSGFGTEPETTIIVGDDQADFAELQTYTVKAESGASSQYDVTVRIDNNNDKEITAFYFASPAAVGSIDQGAKTITVSVPNGTNLATLSPTVSYTGVSLDPPSGRAVNFSSPVTYNVAARNGTVQPYTVRVIPKPATTKDITGFSLPGAGALETVIGAIPDPDGLIPISITVSGQSDIAALCPTITHTGVSITPPGGTPQTGKPFVDSARNFNVPQAYRVTAEDGSFKDYAVSVHVSGGGAKIITGFVFKAVPVDGGKTVSVVGQIDQETHTIEVKVPHTATTLTLAPTITYLGKSVSFNGTPPNTDTAPAGQKGNTYTDTTARDFSASGVTPLVYTVTMSDPGPDNIQEYTVKVSKIPEVTISYDGPRDDKFTEESFDQSTGLLTVTILDKITDLFPLGASINTYKYGPSYGWYVDGIEQNVSNTQNTLVITTAGFPPGRHQVTVSATKSTDGKHYTNTLYFLVQE